VAIVSVWVEEGGQWQLNWADNRWNCMQEAEEQWRTTREKKVSEKRTGEQEEMTQPA